MFWDYLMAIMLLKLVFSRNQHYLQKRICLVLQCLYYIFILLFYFSILYEFITEKSAWKNFVGKDPKLVY